MRTKISVLFFISLMLAGCASGPLKAPCDEHAHYCGMKTKINQW